MEELVEEILLRLPPHEPASLARAALICKPWCRLISSPRFRRRFREHHRTPPMLGFIGNNPRTGASFVSTTTASSPLHAIRYYFPDALDARHGRVLLLRDPRYENHLVVWDTVTEELRKLPPLPWQAATRTAAVLCTNTPAGDCDHVDCHRGPFLVVFVGCDPDNMFVCTYSSDDGAWSEPIWTQNPNDCYDYGGYSGSLLQGSALYLGIPMSNTTLRYNLKLHEVSWIQLPVLRYYYQRSVLTTMEDGGLGLLTIGDSYGVHDLCVWLRKDSPNANAGWTQSKVIDLRRVLGVDPLLMPDSYVAGFADGLGIVFVNVAGALYIIDLNTYMVKMVYKCTGMHAVFPYMSFCFPALEAACFGEEPSAGGSSA